MFTKFIDDTDGTMIKCEMNVSVAFLPIEYLTKGTQIGMRITKHDGLSTQLKSFKRKERKICNRKNDKQCMICFEYIYSSKLKKSMGVGVVISERLVVGV